MQAGGGGAREMVMGGSTKGEGHYLWISGTPGVIGLVKSMIYAPQTGPGEGGSVFCCRNPI